MSRRAQGYATITHPEQKLVEMDTISCCHCNCVVHMHKQDGTKKAPENMGGFCRQCMAPTCANQQCNDGCRAFMRKIDAAEKRQRLFDAVGV